MTETPNRMNAESSMRFTMYLKVCNVFPSFYPLPPRPLCKGRRQRVQIYQLKFTSQMRANRPLYGERSFSGISVVSSISSELYAVISFL